jgi:LacI family transcriptional regulator
MPRGRPRIVDEVLHRLLRGLATGMWPAGTTIPPSRKLAAMFDVAPGTLRKALGEASRLGLLKVQQRQPVLVREGAAQKAESLMTRMSLRRSANRVALLMPEQLLPLRRNDFYTVLVAAVQREASRHGFATSLVPWPEAEQMSLARSLPHKGFDAAILIGTLPAYTGSLFVMFEQGFPFVVFNRRIPGLPLPTVLMDDGTAVCRIVDHLVALGHRNLCFVGSLPDQTVGRKGPGAVVSSWLDYLHNNDLLDECVLPTYFPWDHHQGVFSPSLVELVHSGHRPTAIVFEYVQHARAFLSDRRLADLTVPDDLSLAMIGPTHNLPTVPWCPPMTTAQVSYERVAECLIEMFQKVLAGEFQTQSIRLPLHLTVTDSIGPVPEGVGEVPTGLRAHPHAAGPKHK